MAQHNDRTIPRQRTITERQRLLDGWIRIRVQLTGRRVLSVTLAGMVAAACFVLTSRAQQTVADLGTTAPVQVANRDLPSGHVVSHADLRSELWPIALVPPGALHGDQVGQTLSSWVYAGEPLLSTRVGAGTLGLGTTELAITVPLPLAPPPVAHGDPVFVVSVVAADDLFQPVSQTLTHGRAVEISDTGITVAVAEGDIGPIVEALSTGAIELVIKPN